MRNLARFILMAAQIALLFIIFFMCWVTFFEDGMILSLALAVILSCVYFAVEAFERISYMSDIAEILIEREYHNPEKAEEDATSELAAGIQEVLDRYKDDGEIF